MRKLYCGWVSAAEIAERPMSAPPPSPQKAMTLIGSSFIFPLRGRGAHSRVPGAPELGVHPRHDPRRAVVGRVGHVHAARAAEHDRARPGRLHHQLHDERRLAALARAVARGEELFEGDLLDPLHGLELLRRECGLDRVRHRRPLRYSRIPIHVVSGCALPAAADCSISDMRCTSGTVTSRPPSPQMNPSTGGRFSAGYSAARTSVATTPLVYGEPKEKSRSITPTALNRP